jgi:hypothetical protein
MREFIVKTNFGHTYRWSSERIAQDYADTAIQWQDENEVPKTYEELYQTIVGDEDFLTQWFNDYIRSDVSYAVAQAELIAVDDKKYKSFIDWAIDVHGVEV